MFDFLIVGAGFTGSVLAERLANNGKSVLLCDQREHIGGNAYDRYDDAGILVHEYGPHIFHTNSADVFSYLSRFTRWHPYEHKVKAQVDGKLLPIPINLDTVNELYGFNLSSDELTAYFEEVREARDVIRTSEDVIVSKVGRDLYEKFFKNYTKKQWGVDPSGLDSSVIARIPVRTNRDDRYFGDKYQAMPKAGYTEMFRAMLDHPRIGLALGESFEKLRHKVKARQIIYTGPVDAYFNHCFGKLPYRSLEFKHKTFDQVQFQDAPVVNYPNEHAYTRISEFKQFTGQQHAKTSVVYEYPGDSGDPYYPIPNATNAALYEKYHALAEQTPNVHFCGRLGTYRYYNMDQCVAAALALASRIVGVPRHELVAASA
jgi:UDP-galactopyranose mutase